MSGLLPVDEALKRLVSAVSPERPTETVGIEEITGRVLAKPLIASRTQPPFSASAMDGYAVRAEDLRPGERLRLVGESAAGAGWHQPIAAGETVRIFTGAPVPPGADTILIQENAQAEGTSVIPKQIEPKGRFIRPLGIDFKQGQSFFSPGQRMLPRHMALAASLGPGTAEVFRKPRIAVLATGDELVPPGAVPGPDQIVAANHLTILAMIERAGGEGHFLGIVRDEMAALDDAISRAHTIGADALVTLGGASEGDHDLVRKALTAAGLQLDFWKIAMRPGKPLMFGGMEDMLALGLPGNPASAVVCAHIFLLPLIAALAGEASPLRDRTQSGVLGRDLPENDLRAEYMRASLAEGPDGRPVLTPFPAQDSSLTHVLAAAEALVFRAAHAPAAKAGDACRWLTLE